MLMLLPFQVTMVPNVLTLRAMGLLNTAWAVILPTCFAPCTAEAVIEVLKAYGIPILGSGR